MLRHGGSKKVLLAAWTCVGRKTMRSNSCSSENTVDTSLPEQEHRGGAGRSATRTFICRDYIASAAIWLLFPSIFVLDLITPRENVSVCFAYVIPIFVSLFETRSRPVFYAAVATVLSLGEPLVQGPHDLSMNELTMVMEAGHRLLAIVTQWIAASLVQLQLRRLVDARDKAEFQHRFLDILSHEIGTALTTVTGQAYRLAKLSEKLAPTDVT